MTTNDSDTQSKKAVLKPYPGLRFYEDGQAEYFAGRDEDVTACAAQLVAARVLILHGRTGCGKSSFLRAGVKPRVANLNLGLNFSEGFVVIRSTADPMMEFVRTVLEMTIDFLERGTSEFGPLDEFADPGEILDHLRKQGAADLSRQSLEARASEYAENAEAFFELFNFVLRQMENAPILVVDQGEEVFTLRTGDEGLREDAGDKGLAANEDRRRREEILDRRVEAYFKFLHLFALKGGAGRIVVSLRTEYKGLFEDRIASAGPDNRIAHPGRRLSGFYLKELGERELREAILRPTIKADSESWAQICKSTPSRSTLVAPFNVFGFTIEQEVVDDLVEELLGASIPFGGVLPAMQVSCLSLYEQAKRTQGSQAKGALKINSSHYRRLGEIGNQVEDYLVRQIEDICSVAAFRQIPEATEIWLWSLYALMVRVEADGRAVTKSVDREALIERVRRSLTGHDDEADLASDVRSAVSALCDESRSILKKDTLPDKVTLGHDSLALALRKWALQNPRDHMGMMMRMGMGSMMDVDELQREDLFLREDPPHETLIDVPRDYLWDRQLPHFASAMKFTERLGFTFNTSNSAIDALSTEKDRPKTWDRLKEAIVNLDTKYGSGKRFNDPGATQKGELNRRVMVAADWGAFFPEKDVELRKQAYRFSDVLVSNIAVGNVLMGPSATVDAQRADLDKGNKKSFEEDLKKIIRDSLREVIEARGEILCADASGQEMLVFAAGLVGGEVAYFEDSANVKVLGAGAYGRADPLVDFLLEDKQQARPRYIVGSAFARAMSIQCGYFPYFGTKSLTQLTKFEMERRQRVSYERKLKGLPPESLPAGAIKNLTDRTQRSITHTLWQLGIQASQWNQGLNRAMVLRFASVGYFTSEFARTNMEKFVTHIHGFIREYLDREGKGNATDGAWVGQRLSRRAVKEAIQECFYFSRFDELGTEVFDLDARLAYWSDHGACNTKSIAGEVYSELVRLRQKTIEHFGLTSQAIGWLRSSGTYEPMRKRVSLAFRLKELAWNNFRIFNFYDSERYMALAAQLLTEEMEGRFRQDEEGALLKMMESATMSPSSLNNAEESAIVGKATPKRKTK